MLRRSLVVATVLLGFASAGRAADDQFFDSNGVKIHYTVRGRGEPVLLIHGFACNIPVQWTLPGIERALAANYRVIAFDNRGHGLSDKPHDPKQYGLEMIEDAVRLLDHLHIQKAHVVGYSMGAIITAKLLTTHPDRLLSATLGGAGAIRDGADFASLHALADDLDSGKGFGRLLLYLNPAQRRPPTEEQIRASNAILSSFNDTKAMAAVVRGWDELKVRDDELKANKVPTLAIVGAVDPLKPGVDALRGRLSNLRIVVIDAADHMDAFRKPEFMAALTKFLAQHSAAKARQPAPVAAGS